MRAFIISCLLLFLFSCKEEKAIKNPVEIKPKNEVKIKTKKAIKTIRIYDLQSDGTGSFVNIPAATTKGDPLRNAIGQFFESANWSGNYRSVRLNRIGMINKQALFSFGGKATFDNEKDKNAFRAALDSTIIEHYKNNRFMVHLNGKKW